MGYKSQVADVRVVFIIANEKLINRVGMTHLQMVLTDYINYFDFFLCNYC